MILFGSYWCVGNSCGKWSKYDESSQDRECKTCLQLPVNPTYSNLHSKGDRLLPYNGIYIDGAKTVLDVVNVTASLYLFIGNTIIFRVNRVPDESHLILKDESVFLYSLNLKIDTP